MQLYIIAGSVNFINRGYVMHMIRKMASELGLELDLHEQRGFFSSVYLGIVKGDCEYLNLFKEWFKDFD